MNEGSTEERREGRKKIKREETKKGRDSVQVL